MTCGSGKICHVRCAVCRKRLSIGLHTDKYEIVGVSISRMEFESFADYPQTAQNTSVVAVDTGVNCNLQEDQNVINGDPNDQEDATAYVRSGRLATEWASVAGMQSGLKERACVAHGHAPGQILFTTKVLTGYQPVNLCRSAFIMAFTATCNWQLLLTRFLSQI
jgi:hypothetical protein